MSLSLRRSKYWLKLLMDPSTEFLQIKGLIKTASKNQLQTLLEIIYNLIQNQNIPVSEDLKTELKKYRWNYLLKPHISLKKKKAVILNSLRELMILIHSVKSILLELMKDD